MSTMKKLSFLLALSLVLCLLCGMLSIPAFADENTEGGENTEGETCEHTYDNECDTKCNKCEATRTAPHKYDDECDKECNLCKATRTPPHKYDNACDKECNLCKTTRSADHKYDNEDDAECNVCKAIRTVRSPFQKWWAGVNQIFGYVLAGVLFVGGAVGIFFWIPKTKEPKKHGGKRA